MMCRPMHGLLALAVLGGTACNREFSLTPETEVETPADRDPEEEFLPDASTRDTHHWLAFMENLQLAFNGPPVFAVAVHAETPTEVTLTLPQTGWTSTDTVSEGWTTLPLPDAILYPQGSNVTGVHGLDVTATEPIEVIGLHQRLYFSEASLALPDRELGQRYRVLAVGDGENRSSFIVAATRDDTEVIVTPSVDTLAAFVAGSAITIRLDAGETYQVQARGDLTGSLVESDERVAVFSGAADATVSCDARSHAWDQLPPLRRWGTEHVAVPIHGQGGDVIVVLSDTDGTEVRIDCGDPVVLDAGEILREDLDATRRITASEPILVGQLARGGDCTRSGLGDANLVFTTPTALDREGALLFADFDRPQGQSLRTGFSVVRGPLGEGLEADSGYTDSPETPLDGALRGIGFAVSEYDGFTFSLGYDCEGCVPALTEPALCGDEGS